METTFQKIIRKTGRKPTECKCQLCKSQCAHISCLGTPQDIEKIIDAGYKDRIFLSDWAAGVMMGLIAEPVTIYASGFNENGCVFFKDGLCELHDKGLKPTEGRLSHHSRRADNFIPKKSISWAVVKEWYAPENEAVVKRIIEKMS